MFSHYCACENENYARQIVYEEPYKGELHFLEVIEIFL